MDQAASDYRGMSKTPKMKKKPIFKRAFRLLYIGPWIRVMGSTQAEVARETGLNEGYLSQLVSGEKKNPSAIVLSQIADYLGIPISYLYMPPPSDATLDQLSSIDPAILARMRSKKAG